MARHTYRVRFAPDGNGSVFLVEVEEATEPKAAGTPPKTAKENNSRGDGEPMTENQRRFLFRLLAGQGVDGKQAEAHLRDYFTARALGDISKAQASQYIDLLVRDQKGGGK